MTAIPRTVKKPPIRPRHLIGLFELLNFTTTGGLLQLLAFDGSVTFRQVNKSGTRVPVRYCHFRFQTFCAVVIGKHYKQVISTSVTVGLDRPIRSYARRFS